MNNIPKEITMRNTSIRRGLTRFATTVALAGSMASVVAGAAQASQPTPIAPSTQPASVEVCNQNVEVRESDWDVDTNCNLLKGDKVQISASGDIWAGVFLTGRNGPEGWTWTAGSKFPKPTARSFSLLARTDSFYRYIGTGKQFSYFGDGSHLYLRINDDQPGNGNGAFDVNVQVYR